MKKIMFLACMMTSMMAHAQEVDKEKVQTQAEAAVEAKKDLLKVDTGEKVWKFSGVTGLNAAATSLSNWAAGGNVATNEPKVFCRVPPTRVPRPPKAAF